MFCVWWGREVEVPFRCIRVETLIIAENAFDHLKTVFLASSPWPGLV